MTCTLTVPSWLSESTPHISSMSWRRVNTWLGYDSSLCRSWNSFCGSVWRSSPRVTVSVSAFSVTAPPVSLRSLAIFERRSSARMRSSISSKSTGFVR